MTNLRPILTALQATDDLAKIRQLAAETTEGDVVAAPGLVPFALADVCVDRAARGVSAPLVIVTATTRAAEDVGAMLRTMLDPGSVADLPAWETLPHERLSPRSDTVARRIATLRRLQHPSEHGAISALVVPVRSLLQPMVKGLGDLVPVTVRVGERQDLGDLQQQLIDAAYSRVDMVERRGEFAVRGGILDVFPPTEPHPLRLEFFGDEVEEIRFFSVADQRSLQDAPEGLYAPPCREILLTDTVRERARALTDTLPGARSMLEKIASGIAVEGMESLSPVLVDGMQALTDVLPTGSAMVLLDPERIRARAEDLVNTTEEFLSAAWSSAAAGGGVPLNVDSASFLPLTQVRQDALAAGHSWHTIQPFGIDEETAPAHTVLTAATVPPGYGGDLPRVAQDFATRREADWRIVVVTEGAGSARHITTQLSDMNENGGVIVAARFVPDLGEAEPELPPASVTVTAGPLSHGLVSEQAKLLLLCQREVTGKSGARRGEDRRIPARRRSVVDPLQLRPGDYVVHDHHGVGRFVEMTSRKVGSGSKAAMREYLVIEYAPARRGAPGDRLYVPSDQLDQVTKYVGGDNPSMNRMGGSDWSKTKAKARKAVREIAAELVRLYSARQASPGYAFGPDTPWQRELEDAFAYVETPDQLSTIDEVKRDMERAVPMDRLICGDVGYGKTEIAVRAAFKAVQDGKQVVVLCPTTLLAQQHLETFSERYAGFPVTVKALSRFQNAAESEAVIDGLRDGSVDVVIGTHRLITGQVRFKNLGLVVIDEEQRFGVEHKETLKAMRTDVDILAMSATPIPRTLEMAVTGIREMSTLATPPEERHPVLTYVGPWEEKQVAAAIRRELLREGQVFYIHNRVEDIERTAQRLRDLVPDARVEVAHGKMNEHQLERVIVDFWEKRFDVLVCTTIVETGLDIANANTLIVENADRFGLSQLHQLRGRVGRGRERAYAYFLHQAMKPLTETAHDRLTTLATHTDLGSGMQVAMKDLEIRGAGNLLGGEQSGHIAGVGFDLYIRMVGEAVSAFRGDANDEVADVRVELPLDAHLPHDYIPSERLRLEAYGKLSQARDESMIEEVRAELVDRYGPVPAPAEVLFDAARFRLTCRQAGITEVQTQGKMIRVGHLDVPDSVAMRLKRLYPGTLIKPTTRLVLVPQPTTARIGGAQLRDHELLDWCRTLVATLTGQSVGTA
ncbi:transcription-repair coupling factor [Devriesea agamarum]|uniref:transcription-repair coupling factor n=1 Tax=Devriesea agamarum TaxID=472569 RepID=UPI00071D04AB|nr:transcription-repair coupling factor [Devriesea agamarum]